MIRIDIYIYRFPIRLTDFRVGGTRFSVWRRGETGFACSASALPPSIVRRQLFDSPPAAVLRAK